MHIQSFRSSSLVVRGSQRRRMALVTAALAAALSGHAWADEYVDAIGSPVKSLGRVNSGTPSRDIPSQHICDIARDARTRNSPTAPNFEAQCLAAGGPPSGNPGTPSGRALPGHICDSARDARARNSPIASNLEAQCLASGGKP